MSESNLKWDLCISDCLVVEKVFDQCALKDEVTRCFPIPTGYSSPCKDVDLSLVNKVKCEVLSVDCEVVNVGPQDEQSYSIVTVRQMVELEIELWNWDADCPANSVLLCKFTETINDFCSQVRLYVPPVGALFGPGGGPFVFCEVADFVCGCLPVTISETVESVVCTVKICKVIEVTAFVKLQIPTFGYCVPGPCETVPGPDPEFECPPSSGLFPPQKHD